MTNLASDEFRNVATVKSNLGYLQSQRPEQLIWGYFCLELIRQFEQALLEKEIQVLVHGPIHSSIGQEGVAVGTAMALTSGDKITSTHRAHHHFLAKAVAHYGPPCNDIESLASREVLKNCVRRTMAEIMGLNAGWVGGRGGSMHLFDDESGNAGTQAIVAGNIPYTSGLAYAEKFRKTGNVALAYLGDGSICIGPFHEGLCIAKVYDLPAIFMIDNNQYGVSTGASEATGLDDLAVRAAGYNIPGLIVDGMNPLAVKRAVELAKAHAVEGHGPVLVEAKTYRYLHQSGDMVGSAFGYRTKQEEAEWADRDPLKAAPQGLIQSGILDEAGVERVSGVAASLVADAVDFCTEVVDGNERRIRPSLLPDPDDVTVHIRSDGHEFDGVVYRELADYAETRDIKLLVAKSEVIGRWMERDPETFIVGEDVANLRGGPYGATRDALKAAPERVHNAPIAEGGIVGMGHGAAVAGMRPISEIMFCDFALIGADELFNQVATCRYMYNGRVDVPLVVRSRCSAKRGFGAQHSGDTVGLFALYPGWRIVAPTNPFDYIGLFNSAMHCLDPVLVLEHHELDPITGPAPKDDIDYFIPLGKASVPREGNDLTIVTYLSLVPRVLRIAQEMAAEKQINIEVIDLRSLDYASIDFDAIQASVSKTGKVMIVEQAMETQSLGGHIAARVHEACHKELTQPVTRICSHSAPIPVSKTLEDAVLIRDDTIREKILQVVAGQTSATNP